MNVGPNATNMDLHTSRDSVQTAKRLGRCVCNCLVGPVPAPRGFSFGGYGTPESTPSWRMRASNVSSYIFSRISFGSFGKRWNVAILVSWMVSRVYERGFAVTKNFPAAPYIPHRAGESWPTWPTWLVYNCTRPENPLQQGNKPHKYVLLAKCNTGRLVL